MRRWAKQFAQRDPALIPFFALHSESFESLAGSPQGLPSRSPKQNGQLSLTVVCFGAQTIAHCVRRGGWTRPRSAGPTRPAWRVFRVPCGKSAGTSLPFAKTKRPAFADRCLFWCPNNRALRAPWWVDSPTFRGPDSPCMASLSSPLREVRRDFPPVRQNKTASFR